MKYFLIILIFLFGLVLHGAVPFISMTTLGQAVSVVGYPISFINDLGVSLYASNMGYPAPSPMSTMLAPSIAMLPFLQLGLHASDAFTLAFIIWFSIGYYGAYKVARYFGVSETKAAILILLWLCFPIHWNSSDYSHLHFGFVLLPFLFYWVIRLVYYDSTSISKLTLSISYLFATLLAVFTDGYTFMVFAAGASLILMHQYIVNTDRRVAMRRFALPLHALAFIVAYILYALYIGKAQYAPAQIEFFRGWGLDLTFAILPSHGVHWFWDAVGFSVSRSDKEYYGDASVWNTTFILPMLLLGGYLYSKIDKSKNNIVNAALLVSIFGFYMAMGPSVKVNAVKPHEVESSLISVEHAGLPTGSAILSKYVPGFKNMRASYRWIVLTYLGLWFIVLFYLSQSNRENKWQIVGLLVVIGLFVPDTPKIYSNKVNHYESFQKIDADILLPLKSDLFEGEKVAFLPIRNDFLVNYLAPQLNVYSYNIGGDKNLKNARGYWPDVMSDFPVGYADKDFMSRILLLLARNEVDVVILPYIDLLWAAHKWPNRIEYKDSMLPVVSELSKSPYVDVMQRELYSIIRVKPEYQNSEYRKDFEARLTLDNCITPYCLLVEEFTSSTPSRVGYYKGGKLYSDGKEGLIHFGPYMPMKAGEYELAIYGAVNKISNSWVDVVSDMGTESYGKFDIKVLNSPDNIIANGRFRLDKTVSDIEIRVFSGEKDSLILYGYSMRPAVIEMQH